MITVSDAQLDRLHHELADRLDYTTAQLREAEERAREVVEEIGHGNCLACVVEWAETYLEEMRN